MKGLRIVWPKASAVELEEFELRKPEANEVLLETEYTIVSACAEKTLDSQEMTVVAYRAAPGNHPIEFPQTEQNKLLINA